MAWSFSKRYNTEKLFDVETSGFDYFTLEDLWDKYGDDENTIYVIRGVYINTRSMFEPQPVIALEDCYVNLPSHLTNLCREMLSDRLFINAVNKGQCGFTIYKYLQKRFNEEYFGVRWVDVPIKVSKDTRIIYKTNLQRIDGYPEFIEEEIDG